MQCHAMPACNTYHHRDGDYNVVVS